MKWRVIKPTKACYSIPVSGKLGLVIVANKGKSEIIVELVHEDAQALVLGIVNSKNQDSLELKVTTVHRAPNTHAETMIHGLVAGYAQAQIKGLIQIKKKAQRVTDFLTERVLLLSSGARAIAEPELEIEADEVRASHAATVSSLDKNELFYLMSRGLSAPAAEKLITEGFLQHVINRIDNDKIRLQVSDYVKR